MTPPAQVWSGKELARVLEAELAREVAEFSRRGRAPRLEVLLVGEDPASQTYVGEKAKAAKRVGIEAATRNLPAGIAQEALLAEIEGLNAADGVDGILVQLPLPAHLDAEAILARMEPDKDVDGFHPVNLGRLAAGQPRVVPCTPLGIVELLLRHGCPPRGREVVVVGRGRTVGVPLALLLAHKGEAGDATVTVCHSRTRDLAAHCRRAEILVAAIGSPRVITADMVRPGAVVIDVGISRVPDPAAPRGYRLSGDVDFESVKEVAAAVTPVPGGVGPLTVAMLLRNTLRAAQRRTSRTAARSDYAASGA